MKLVIFGIDPGELGGIVSIEATGALMNVETMPRTAGRVDARKLARLMPAMAEGIRPDNWLVVIEQGAARPRQGVSAMFSFGRHCGLVEGVAHGLGADVELVRPAAWHRYICEIWPAMFPLSGKSRSIEVATQVFPTIRLIPPGYKRTQDGLADAACLAWYGHHRLNLGCQNR